MTWYLLAALVVIGLLVIAALLRRIGTRGGTSDQDAASIADQVLSEADMFRGSQSADDPRWDGQTRLAEPTSEGMNVWPAVVAPPRRDDGKRSPS